MTYTCQCPCGTTRYEIHGEPIVRFYCHCTICQKQYDAPYVDVTLFKRDAVELPEDHGITFAQYKKFAPVDRGKCPSCEKPILSKMGKGENAYAFAAVRNYVNPESLPPAQLHVFYGTRVADAEDDLPKYSNGITSRFAFIKYMMGK